MFLFYSRIISVSVLLTITGDRWEQKDGLISWKARLVDPGERDAPKRHKYQHRGHKFEFNQQFRTSNE